MILFIQAEICLFLWQKLLNEYSKINPTLIMLYDLALRSRWPVYSHIAYGFSFHIQNELSTIFDRLVNGINNANKNSIIWMGHHHCHHHHRLAANVNMCVNCAICCCCCFFVSIYDCFSIVHYKHTHIFQRSMFWKHFRPHSHIT